MFWTDSWGRFEFETHWDFWAVGIQIMPKILYTLYLGPFRFTFNPKAWRDLMRSTKG